MRRRSFLALLGLAPVAPTLLESALTAPVEVPGPLVCASTQTGKTWTSLAALDGCYRQAYSSVVLDGRRWIAVGPAARAVSSDGVTWTTT